MTLSTDPYYQRLLGLMATHQDLDAATAADPELAAGLEAERIHDFVPADVRITDERLPGPHGAIPVRIYRRHQPEDDQPMLVWCHGGAFAFGDIDMPEADVTARMVAARSGAVVVSVDYRRAVGGVHYPVPLDDVVGAYEEAIRLAETYGVSRNRVHLGGASAGANLAAGACLKLRDAGGYLPSSLLLLYPCMHPVLPPASAELAAKLTRLPAQMRFESEVFETGIENYLGAPANTATGYAMPALADVRGLPRTLLVNCEYDNLRASGEAFAAALRAANVEVELRTAPNVTHGHLNRPHLAEAQRTLADMSDWIKEN